MVGIATQDHIPWRAHTAEDGAVVLCSRDHATVCAQGYAVEQRTGKVLIEVRPLLPVVCRSYNPSIIAVVRDAGSCPGEGDHSLVGMDAAGWIVTPLISISVQVRPPLSLR